MSKKSPLKSKAFKSWDDYFEDNKDKYDHSFGLDEWFSKHVKIGLQNFRMKNKSNPLPEPDEITKARSMIGRINNAILQKKTTHEWRVANAKKARAACKRNPVKKK